jgi:hypothetical protein
MNMLNKLALGFKFLASRFVLMASRYTLQASSRRSISSNCDLRIQDSEGQVIYHELGARNLMQRSNRLVACGLQLVAFITLISLHPTATAQTSFPPVTINLSYPQNQSLKLDGGFMYINDAGIQGVILYRVNETTYVAFERKCSINDDAPVIVDGSSLFMKGCNATYSFSDGYPTSGQTTQPLLKYRTSLTGQTLVITDEVDY